MLKYLIILITILSLSSFANSTTGWTPVTTKINHKAWKKDNKILVFKRRLLNKPLKQKVYQQIIIKNKTRMLKLIGAQDWSIRKRHSSSGIFYIQGTYKDSKGREVQFLEGHHFQDNELKLVLQTKTLQRKSKQASLNIEMKEVQEVLSDFL